MALAADSLPLSPEGEVAAGRRNFRLRMKGGFDLLTESLLAHDPSGPPVEGWRLGLGVLPALENKFEAVAVGVEHIAGIVTRIVIEPSTWFAIVSRARRHRGGIG